MKEDPNLIVVDGLVKSYAGSRQRVLNNISLKITEGECFGLIGPNGAGKTTLLSCLLGLVKPDLGKITIGGIAHDDLAVREITGFMPERPNFERLLTAREFLKLHYGLAKRPRRSAKQEIDDALVRVGLEEKFWDRRIKTFSRGMLQRLGLAQALIGRPKILFLDEPGSGMDPLGHALLRKLFMQFKRDQITVVVSSHHLDEMERVCDRVALIREGKIETIENLNLPCSYTITVHWLETDDPDRDEKLVKCSAAAVAQLLSKDGHSATFLVSNSLVAANLLRELISEDVKVMSAQPDQTKLERLFPGLSSSDTEHGGMQA